MKTCFALSLGFILCIYSSETIEIKINGLLGSYIVYIYTQSDSCCRYRLPYMGHVRTGICFVHHIPLHVDLFTKSVFRSTWSCSPFLFSRLPSILTIHFSKQTFFPHILQDPKLSLGRKLLYKMFHSPLLSTLPNIMKCCP